MSNSPVLIHPSILTDPTVAGWSDGVWRCFVSFIILAGQTREQGTLIDDENRPLLVTELARHCHKDWRTVRSFIDQGLTSGKLRLRDDGAIIVTGWRKWQLGQPTRTPTRTPTPDVGPRARASEIRSLEGQGVLAIDVNYVREGGVGGDSTLVRQIYDHWRTVRSKTDRRFNNISEGRRAKIKARLREYPADELLRAIDAVALDPWEDRPRHDDLTIIFRSQEAVDRCLGWAEGNSQRLSFACPECGVGLANERLVADHRELVHDVVKA